MEGHAHFFGQGTPLQHPRGRSDGDDMSLHVGKDGLPAPTRRPCQACQHPRDTDRRMGAAMTTVGALRNNGKASCLICRLFISAIDTLVGPLPEEHLEDFEDSRVTIEFHLSYLGDSLALNVIYSQMRISFFAISCKSTRCCVEIVGEANARDDTRTDEIVSR